MVDPLGQQALVLTHHDSPLLFGNITCSRYGSVNASTVHAYPVTHHHAVCTEIISPPPAVCRTCASAFCAICTHWNSQSVRTTSTDDAYSLMVHSWSFSTLLLEVLMLGPILHDGSWMVEMTQLIAADACVKMQLILKSLPDRWKEQITETTSMPTTIEPWSQPWSYTSLQSLHHYRLIFSSNHQIKH